ncbi:MAG: DUF4337 domain-containing protein [Acidisphaera sp.]|nr:DUF4337 domain-containing protein [Acidisphaera sp.]
MSETLEHAREGLEHAHHSAEGEHPHNPFAVRVAILISVLAATLAIVELGEKSAQNDYLTRHVSTSDDYAFYQAKTMRWSNIAGQLDILQSLPGAADPAVQKRIADLTAERARLDDDVATQGRKQLLDAAHRQEEGRDHAFHLYHSYELAVGALQIAIVLASVSVVTRLPVMAWAAGLLGGGAGLFALWTLATGIGMG